jgi:hypothetical protein
VDAVKVRTRLLLSGFPVFGAVMGALVGGPREVLVGALLGLGAAVLVIVLDR